MRFLEKYILRKTYKSQINASKQLFELVIGAIR